jgi:hypothetical protein
MAIPAEFNYGNEHDFVQRFLIPLLHRLGFSMTVNYHGTREFGRDLIFAEFDRFGHVRYHALQAKYVPSISVNDAQDLITDGRLAFTNPFDHPQTGTREYISTFYAVNGGSIAEGAVTTFFNALKPVYGGNVRLLEGKDLISLDRWATITRGESIAAVLSGMLGEIRSNARIAPGVTEDMRKHVEAEGPFPIFRVRNSACTLYLQRPLLPNAIPFATVEEYWWATETFNYICNSMDVSVYASNFKKDRLEALPLIRDRILQWGASLEQNITRALGAVGPLIPL